MFILVSPKSKSYTNTLLRKCSIFSFSVTNVYTSFNLGSKKHQIVCKKKSLQRERNRMLDTLK